MLHREISMNDGIQENEIHMINIISLKATIKLAKSEDTSILLAVVSTTDFDGIPNKIIKNNTKSRSRVAHGLLKGE